MSIYCDKNYGYVSRGNVQTVEQDYMPLILATKSNNWLRLHGYPMRREKGNASRVSLRRQIRQNKRRGFYPKSILGETPSIHEDIDDIIKMFFAQGHLYKRMNGHY